jgi:hypothetical protein
MSKPYWLFLLLFSGCSLFKPVSSQVAIVQPLCVGCIEVFDVNDGPPLLSTPHRMVVWRDESGYHYAPETSEPNVFSMLENIPASTGSLAQSAGGAALGARP